MTKSYSFIKIAVHAEVLPRDFFKRRKLLLVTYHNQNPQIEEISLLRNLVNF